MSVRLKLALTIFATGLLTALLVIATVVYSFQRFENETAYRRGMGFLSRVVSMYDNIFDMHEKDAVAFQAWLRALVLFEPDTEPDDIELPFDAPIGEDDRSRLIEALSLTPTPVDVLVSQTGLTPSTVQVLLLELDLAGRLERAGGQLVALRA